MRPRIVLSIIDWKQTVLPKCLSTRAADTLHASRWVISVRYIEIDYMVTDNTPDDGYICNNYKKSNMLNN